MEKITDIKVTDCIESLYIRPFRMQYKQDGREKIWDLVKVHDSVAVLMFNITRRTLVFVKQFRPAVYYNRIPHEDQKIIDPSKYPPSLGVTVELCAGIVDKNKSLEVITQEEMFEECGYQVPLSEIKKVTSYRSGVGVSGPLQTLFYAEVTDSMKIHSGGGNDLEGEYIDVVELSLDETKKILFDENAAKPVSMMFALMWFFDAKRHYLEGKQPLPKL